MVARLQDTWFVQPFQYGSIDASEAGNSFDSEEAANLYAEEWAANIAYDSEYQHEIVVFKAVAAFRGKVTPEKHRVRKDHPNDT